MNIGDTNKAVYGALCLYLSRCPSKQNTKALRGPTNYFLDFTG